MHDAAWQQQRSASRLNLNSASKHGHAEPAPQYAASTQERLFGWCLSMELTSGVLRQESLLHPSCT